MLGFISCLILARQNKKTNQKKTQKTKRTKKKPNSAPGAKGIDTISPPACSHFLPPPSSPVSLDI